MFFVEFAQNRSRKAFNLTATHTIEVGSQTNEKGFIELSHDRTSVKLVYENKEAAIQDFNGLMAAIRTGEGHYELSGDPD